MCIYVYAYIHTHTQRACAAASQGAGWRRRPWGSWPRSWRARLWSCLGTRDKAGIGKRRSKPNPPDREKPGLGRRIGPFRTQRIREENCVLVRTPSMRRFERGVDLNSDLKRKLIVVCKMKRTRRLHRGDQIILSLSLLLR